MSAPARVIAAPVIPSVAGLPDFSERLSPMLVKELRQGMRSPIFVWGLIVMNLFLAGAVWLTIEAPEEEVLHQAFFGGYCALVCGLLPLRAAGALHDELRGNTIDTLILTKLTGWRITMGKWVAVVAQQLLATITVLPYLIVRYFAGGIDVPMELAWLGIYLLAGMGSAAILTGFSWIKFFLFRSAIMMGMTFLTGAFCVGTLETIFGYRQKYLLDEMYQEVGWGIFVLLGTAALHAGFFAMDLGASKVGSLVENRSLSRRLVAVVAMGIYALVALWENSGTSFSRAIFYNAVPAILASVTFGVIACQAMLERPVDLVSQVLPWVRRGWWARAAGRFFYPGWPAGVLFTVVLLVGSAGVAVYAAFEVSKGNPPGGPRYGGIHFSERNLMESVGGFGALLGVLPVPLVLWRWFLRKRVEWHFGTFLMLLAFVGAVQVGIMGLASAMEKPNVLKLGLPIPPMSWAWMDAAHGPNYRPGLEDREYFDWDYGTITLISGSVTVFWWMMAGLTALLAFRQTREVEAEALGLVKPEPGEALGA